MFEAPERPELITFSDTDFADDELLDRPPFIRRRSPLMCTIHDPDITTVDIQRLMEAGMNIARIKISYSTKSERMKLLGKIDKAASSCCDKFGVVEWPVSTCVTLKTCVVRTGLLEGETDSILLKEDNEVVLTHNLSYYNKCNEHTIFVDYAHLTIDVKVGMEIIIDQEEIILECTSIINEKSIKCVVIVGGKLVNMAILSVRGGKHSRPQLTKRDLQIITFAIEYEVDIIIVNYVQQVETVRKIKHFMKHFGNKVKRPAIYSGFCTQQGLDNVDDIIKESDGILLPREFLTYELESKNFFKMPIIQKWLAGKCQAAGKPFFISGGVCDMLMKGTTKYNEIADLTNALLDGVSGFNVDTYDPEIAVLAIRAINDVCCSVEPFTHNKKDFLRVMNEIKVPVNAAESCIMACAMLANQSNAKVIVIPTVTGRTARALLHMKPSCIVMTVSTNLRTTRLLQSYRSVVALRYVDQQHKKWNLTIEARIMYAIEYAVKKGWIKYRDNYVTLQKASELSCFCDKVCAEKVTISKKSLVECLDDEHEKQNEEY